MSEKLSAEDWIDEGIATLKQDGFVALKAAPLAAALGVSRGSFYWHFHDIEAFQEAVLDRWHRRATGLIIADVEAAHPAEQRLAALLRRVFQSDPRLENAIRAWGFSSAAVRERIALVDRHRLDYVEILLKQSGQAPDRAAALSQLFYWSYLGFVLSGGVPPGGKIELIIESLLRLAEQIP